MPDNPIKQESIVKDIIDGALTIDTTEEFEDLLKMFPDDPTLHKAFADLLVRLKAPAEDATKAYKKSTALFIEAGMTLQAVGAKLLEWNMSRPTQQDAWAFFSDIRKSNTRNATLQNFFSRLSFPQLVALLANLELMRLPADRMIKKFGSSENYMFFIVSGKLVDTQCRPMGKDGEITTEKAVSLGPDDFFGDIYPFERKRISQSYVKTLTRVELIKISKDRLINVCREHPDVEKGFRGLIDRGREIEGAAKTYTVRKALRHKISLDIRMQIFTGESGEDPLVLEGLSNDISMGGACVLLNADSPPPPDVDLINRETNIIISLSDKSLSISVRGVVVWQRAFVRDEEEVEVLGVRFRELPPKLSGILVVFATALGDMSKSLNP
ncbi:MAG: cyclic nucleotide-binding domain-containing protein [Desulfobacterales bacterium]|nr:cyclic nucleotide-binding domain-containing protein [Desulfobacterales bacterium]